MRHVLTNAGKRSLAALGYYGWRLQQATFPGVAVLCYHGILEDTIASNRVAHAELHVLASELDAHCAFLKRQCHPLSLSQWLDHQAKGTPLPERAVHVTFDDGYRNVFTLAKPILEAHEIPATVFVTSEPVRQRRMFWHDSVALAQGASKVESMKSLAYGDWREMCEELARTVDDDSPYAPLTTHEVGQLAASPLIEIGGHSVSHAILARASAAEQRREVTLNRTDLQRWTGRPIRAFAYPNGRAGLDYSEETKGFVRDAGYEAAFTTEGGFATDLGMETKRFLMLSGISAAELAHRLTHSWRRK